MKKNADYGNITSIAAMVESVIGCKWSLAVLTAIKHGVVRPGAISRSCEGLSTKVLNERLKKLTAFGILRRVEFAEIPPHVEYHFTPFGSRFLKIIDEAEKLQEEVDQGNYRTTTNSS